MEFSRESVAETVARLAMEKAHADADHLYQHIKAYGVDLLADGSMIRFSKGMKIRCGDADVKYYTYVALKAGNFWYLTGEGNRKTWDELVMWLLTYEQAVFPEEIIYLPIPLGWSAPSDRTVPAEDLTQGLQ